MTFGTGSLLRIAAFAFATLMSQQAAAQGNARARQALEALGGASR